MYADDNGPEDEVHRAKILDGSDINSSKVISTSLVR